MDSSPTILDDLLVDKHPVAKALNVSPDTVMSPVFQRRIGLVPIKLGPRLTKFDPANVRAAIANLTRANGGEAA